MYRVTDIEDAILSTLQADAVLAGYVKSFQPIPALDEEVLKQIFTTFPAIGVVSAGGDYDYLSAGANPMQIEVGRFSVLCFNMNLRSAAAPIRGGTLEEKGLWDMIDDCRRVLLGPLYDGSTQMQVASCLPKRRVLLFCEDSFAGASLEVEVKWSNR